MFGLNFSIHSAAGPELDVTSTERRFSQALGNFEDCLSRCMSRLNAVWNFREGGISQKGRSKSHTKLTMAMMLRAARSAERISWSEVGRKPFERILQDKGEMAVLARTYSVCAEVKNLQQIIGDNLSLG